MSNPAAQVQAYGLPPLWQKYCGFLRLSLEEFMAVQKNMLLEQLDLYGRCELGEKILGKARPKTVEEFRESVPLTTYGDYLPFLVERNEDCLPEKPMVWAHTSGKSGYYHKKWAPYTKGMYAATGRGTVASLILGAATKEGEVAIREGDVLLPTLAPPPYASGAVVAPATLQEFPFRCVPPLDEANKMSFQDRIREGFRLGLKTGIDVFLGLPSVLIRIGEQFSGEGETTGQRRRVSSDMLHPSVIARLLQGTIRSRLARRSMYPKDLWTVKCIITGGLDYIVFGPVIERYWGRRPRQMYGSTEFIAIATEAWETDSMTFFPDHCFWEFIPHEDSVRSLSDPSFKPRTLLMDELTPGVYELVGTNFHGGAFVRYRIGDLVRIVSLRNDKLGIDLPQMVFEARADDVIDLGGFVRLSEKTLMFALADAQILFEDWTAVMENPGGKPRVRLYLEPKGGGRFDQRELEERIHHGLCKVEQEYGDLERMLGYRGLQVSVLPQGSFQRYMQAMVAEGADLAHLRVPRMKPKQHQLERLLSADR